MTASTVALRIALAALALAPAHLRAQRQTGAELPALRVLKRESTTDAERPRLDRIVARLRSRAADAAFASHIEMLIDRGQFGAARDAVAQAAGVSRDQVWIPGEPRISLAPGGSDIAAVSFASRRAAIYLVFAIGSKAVCIGDRTACATALRQLGYVPR